MFCLSHCKLNFVRTNKYKNYDINDAPVKNG